MARSRALGMTLALVGLAGVAQLQADRRGDAKAQVAFGIRVAQEGLWREARYRFERAVAIDPGYAAAWNNLAIACEQAGEIEKAREAYEKAVHLAPKDTFIQGNYDLFKELRARTAAAKCPRPPC